jgi:hypothetical protein
MGKYKKLHDGVDGHNAFFLFRFGIIGMKVNLDNILMMPNILYCFNTDVLFFRVR